MKHKIPRWFGPALLWGGLAGTVWTAGLFISFAAWRYAAYIGAILLAAAAGTAVCVLLSRRGWRGFGGGVFSMVLTAVFLTPAIWLVLWFNQMFLTLYRGCHVTEAGFSGVFTLLYYTGVSVLWFLLFCWIPLAWRGGKTDRFERRRP